MQANGDGPALTNTALRLTMFAPSNAAFSTPLTSVSPLSGGAALDLCTYHHIPSSLLPAVVMCSSPAGSWQLIPEAKQSCCAAGVTAGLVPAASRLCVVISHFHTGLLTGVPACADASDGQPAAGSKR